MSTTDADYQNFAWRKASSSQVSSCVEVAFPSREVVVVRDSKDPDGPILRYAAADWGDFISGARAGKFQGFC
jgi:hypothetical protein